MSDSVRSTGSSSCSGAASSSSQPNTPVPPVKKTKLLELLRATALELESYGRKELSIDETVALGDLLTIVENRKTGTEEWGDELVARLWTKAAAQPQFGEDFYQDFFKSSDALEDAFFESSDLRVQSNLLVSMMSKAIALVSKPAQLQQLLEHVGAKHAMYGAEPHHFRLVGECFTRCLKSTLSKDAEFTEEFAKQWERVYNRVAAAMIRSSQTEGALQWKRRSTKQRLEMFSALVKDAAEAHCGGDLSRFCSMWLEEAQKKSNRGLSEEQIVKSGAPREAINSAWSRCVSAMHVLMSSKMRAAAQYNDLSQLAQGAINAAPHVLVWIRTFMDTQNYSDRELLHAVNGGLKALLVRLQPNDKPLSKLNLTVVSLFINLFSEALSAQMSDIVASLPYAPLTTPLGMLMTDVENSTHLFNTNRHAMSNALKLHMNMVKELTKQYHCSEVRVKTIGDSFLIVGADMSRLVALALAIQKAQEELPIMGELAKAAQVAAQARLAAGPLDAAAGGVGVTGIVPSADNSGGLDSVLPHAAGGVPLLSSAPPGMRRKTAAPSPVAESNTNPHPAATTPAETTSAGAGAARAGNATAASSNCSTPAVTSPTTFSPTTASKTALPLHVVGAGAAHINTQSSRKVGEGDSFSLGQLRVKCALHWCNAAAVVGTASATVTDVYDYVGPDVQIPVRVLLLMYGGQIVMTNEAAVRLRAEKPELCEQERHGVLTKAKTSVKLSKKESAAAAAAAAAAGGAEPVFDIAAAKAAPRPKSALCCLVEKEAIAAVAIQEGSPGTTTAASAAAAVGGAVPQSPTTATESSNPNSSSNNKAAMMDLCAEIGMIVQVTDADVKGAANVKSVVGNSVFCFVPEKFSDRVFPPLRKSGSVSDTGRLSDVPTEAGDL